MPGVANLLITCANFYHA